MTKTEKIQTKRKNLSYDAFNAIYIIHGINNSNNMNRNLKIIQYGRHNT